MVCPACGMVGVLLGIRFPKKDLEAKLGTEEEEEEVQNTAKRMRENEWLLLLYFFEVCCVVGIVREKRLKSRKRKKSDLCPGKRKPSLLLRPS